MLLLIDVTFTAIRRSDNHFLMLLDPDQVSHIMREVARKVVMPRFQALARHEILEKAPGDLVTIADLESEVLLAEELTALMPGSTVVGEEGYERDNAQLARLEREAPVWVLDPVDGTHNFAHGKPCFAVIVALCHGGHTLAGWILDPVNDIMAWAAVGQGAWVDGKRVHVAPYTNVESCVGSASNSIRRRLDELRGQPGISVPKRLIRYRCSGREYMDLAAGKLHFARYAGQLKPWDHAAGVLMHREAGGYSRLVDSGAAYTATSKILREPLFLAPDAGSWEALHSIVFPE
jgi:fructose-1,6-bisphosphatase/inositol monophosphatase family enzyme